MSTTPVQTKAQALALLQEHDQELYHFGVKRCGIFGSFVRDAKIHPQSDVDILVAFEPDQKTFDNFMNLSFFLEDLFGRTIDLVTVESLSPYIGPRILEEVEYVSIRP
ncbi:putative nucleotidyltransferase [Leptolyngbya sp. BL0902]|uniref:nucleotidyltransferase family protein n=1 Tax=Leptolyngbya sp. BL0902 TaxID=1115757 RepID=UPI0018E815D0|nr:nucleotidyltransferase family protein [Leptolyngbya sp. BL0902]QQE65213.1 putative nucleotidyltransferase [Leptolyngbya sp. BL0902]